MKTTRGFTLIELLVVVAIVALLASVVLASLNSARDKGRLAGARNFAAQVDHIAGEQAVGLYEFEECSGGPALDSSGNGKTATLGNMSPSPQSTDTPSGTGCSLSFNGTGAYVLTPTLNLPASFTLAVWAKATSLTGGAEEIFKGLLGPVRLLINPDGTIALITPSTSGISGLKLNSWNFIALVYDGTVYKIYIDGALKATSASAVATGTDQYLLGAANTSGYQPFLGFMDSFHIFAKDLTASEVGKLYAEGLRAHSLAAE